MAEMSEWTTLQLLQTNCSQYTQNCLAMNTLSGEHTSQRVTTDVERVRQFWTNAWRSIIPRTGCWTCCAEHGGRTYDKRLRHLRGWSTQKIRKVWRHSKVSPFAWTSFLHEQQVPTIVCRIFIIFSFIRLIFVDFQLQNLSQTLLI